jgi:hypothetical protein
MTSLKSFKNQHWTNLMGFCSKTKSAKDLFEYFEILTNIGHENDKKNEPKPKKTTRTEKSFTKKDIHHCEFCKKTFFTEKQTNFHQIIKAKVHLTHRSSRLFALSKIIRKKYKYRSYKQKQLESITKNGLKLIYKCKRCNQRNVIYKEHERNNLDSLKILKMEKKKFFGLKSRPDACALNIEDKPLKTKFHARNRKFQTLKTMMENDLKEKKKKEELQKSSSLMGLLGFLDKM